MLSLSRTWSSQTEADYIEDADTAPLGLSSFSEATTNRPAGSAGYGVIMTIDNGVSGGFRWLYQLAFVNNGGVSFREKVNLNDWTEWASL